MSKASDEFFSEAEGKLATGRYTAQEFLQIVSHVTEKSFKKMADEEFIYKFFQPQFAGGYFTFSFYSFISMNSLITFELCGYHSSHNSIQSSFSSLI